MKYGILAVVAMSAAIWDGPAMAEGGCPCLNTNGDGYVDERGRPMGAWRQTLGQNWSYDPGHAARAYWDNRAMAIDATNRAVASDIARLGDGGAWGSSRPTNANGTVMGWR